MATKRVEIRADMQINDEFFQHLARKLNRSIVWVKDRKVVTKRKELVFSNTLTGKSYTIKDDKFTNVIYEKMEINGEMKDIQFTKDSDFYIVKNPNDRDVRDIIKASKKDLDWISINNQCFQKIHNSHIDISKDEHKKVEPGEFAFTLLYSKKVIGFGVLKAKSWKKDARRIISEKLLEHFFPVIYLKLKNNLDRMAKESEKEENKKFNQKIANIKREREAIENFKKGETYGDLEQKIRDRDIECKQIININFN